MSVISFQPIRVDTLSADQEGQLILLEDRLIGVLVRLAGDEQAPLQGFWSLEAGFGPLESARPEPFKDMEAARAWVENATQGATITADAGKSVSPGAREFRGGRVRQFARE